jgi:hypothetical protein
MVSFQVSEERLKPSMKSTTEWAGVGMELLLLRERKPDRFEWNCTNAILYGSDDKLTDLDNFTFAEGTIKG